MADEPTSPGWHLSQRGLTAILAVVGLLTLFVQGWFGQRDVTKVDEQVKAIQADVKEIKDSHRPLVYGGKE